MNVNYSMNETKLSNKKKCFSLKCLNQSNTYRIEHLLEFCCFFFFATFVSYQRDSMITQQKKGEFCKNCYLLNSKSICVMSNNRIISWMETCLLTRSYLRFIFLLCLWYFFFRTFSALSNLGVCRIVAVDVIINTFFFYHERKRKKVWNGNMCLRVSRGG